jgi:hypothetical protein
MPQNVKNHLPEKFEEPKREQNTPKKTPLTLEEKVRKF